MANKNKKEQIKLELKFKLDQYKREFPFYFVGNLVVNLVILGLIIFLLPFSHLVEGVFVSVLFLFSLFCFSMKGLAKNIKILLKIRKVDFWLDIRSHEMDHASDFITRLPMKETEVLKIKKILSFENIIEMLEFANIIEFKKGFFRRKMLFSYEIEESKKNN